MRLPVASSTNLLPAYCTFIGISLLFVVSQAFFFQGFHGDDDLHYTWLSAKMLQGSYSLFKLNDIFSGRALLVLLQALVYAIGGINLLTSNLLTYVAVVYTCYLTVFPLMKTVSARLALLASGLFYFNSVIVHIAVGPSPDVLVMLVGVVILLLLKRFDYSSTRRQYILIGFLAGLLCFSTLYIKESGLIFMPFLVGAMLLPPTIKRVCFLVSACIAFGLGVALSGWIYYINTGSAFFRVKQLMESSYPNPCNLTTFFSKKMLARLTYLVWEEFVDRYFLAPLLATVAIFWTLFSKKGPRQLWIDSHSRYFIILLFLALYFPFSVTVYQPLCFKARHFLFILPLAVSVGSRWLDAAYQQPPQKWVRNAIAAFIIGIGVKWSPNGWNWNFHRCLLAILVFFPFLANKKLAAATPVLLVAIIWLNVPYTYIYERKSWYPNLKRMEAELPGKYFYFSDHGNLIHWKLLKQFDTAVHVISFDPKPYNDKPYPYYDSLRFHPGWFLVNHQYNERSAMYTAQIDSLLATRFLDTVLHKGPVSAGYFSTPRQFEVLKQIVASDKRRNCNCN